VGSRAGLEAVEKIKISFTCLETNAVSLAFQAIASAELSRLFSFIVNLE
jgi:hypothetical protein